MRLLVVSDNHGSMDEFCRLMQRQIDIDTVLHLGDGGIHKWEYEKHMPQCMPFICIKGNNDYGLEFPVQFSGELAGERVAAIHGERLQVKTTLEPLTRWAKREQAVLVCYGHTHKADITLENHMLFVNPGSLSGRHSTTGKTYAVVEIDHGHIQAAVYDIEGRLILQECIQTMDKR